MKTKKPVLTTYVVNMPVSIRVKAINKRVAAVVASDLHLALETFIKRYENSYNVTVGDLEIELGG